MANLTVTAANVIASSQAVTQTGVAGAAITAGQALYLDSVTNTLKLADADASQATSQCVGVALNGAQVGQPVVYVTQDPEFTPGATLVIGTIYLVSATAGAIMPAADLASGGFAAQIGTAWSTSKMALEIGSLTRSSAAKA